MDEHKSLEEWADALLDQHRTAPPRSAARAADDDGAGAEDDPLLRLFTRLSGEPPDPDMRQRLRRHRERHRALQTVEAVVSVIAGLGVCALAYAWLSLV